MSDSDSTQMHTTIITKMTIVGVCVFALLALPLVSVVGAKTVSIPHVYRIKSDDCTFAPTARRQTGFRLRDTVGIVTALHGVADCQTISALGDDGTNFVDLVITAVDIEHDMALLSSSLLAQQSPDGLTVSTLVDTDILLADLRVVGYPLGLDKQDVDTIESVRDIESLDDVIPDADKSVDFIQRKSPALTIDVLNLQTQLVPGHSGAPVLDEQDGVVAVGNGGLRGGTVGRSWAIPYQSIVWKSVELPAVKKQLAELATKDLAALAFSTTYPNAGDDDTQFIIYKVRVVDPANQPLANAEVLLTHSAGYEIDITDSEGFVIFQLPTNVSYTQSQVQVEASGYPSYNRTLSNVQNKVGIELVRLPALLPTATLAAVLYCEFAFRLLDDVTARPIARANLTVTLGSEFDTGQSDSNGFYESKLPCTDPHRARVRVRITANGYLQYSATVILIGEVEEVWLSQVATPTLLPTPTATPTTVPSPTATLPPLPTPMPTATITPWPTKMACQVTGGFSALWQENQAKLGCNTSAVITSAITYEPFENGYLVWSKLLDRIYVLPRGSNWAQYANRWNPDENPLPCDQAQSFGYPAMGFGKLWCENGQVRAALGNPTGAEQPHGSAQQQQFEGGFVFEIAGGNSIILFNDGTWSVR